jgi:UDP-N-acetylmuramoylalanine--D-glutamate ligase
MSEFAGRKVAVIGLAATGLATARVLRDRGATVTVYDGKPEAALDPARVAAARELGDGVTLALGAADIDWGRTDLVIPSPGVPRYAPMLTEAVRRGVEVLGEIEVAYRLASAPILAITGTNGKTTTTALVGAICREAGLNTWVAGNIAEDEGKRTPLIKAAVAAPADGVIVAEISSFQLEWVERFRPKVAAWLNITADHFDRHKDMDEYARAKSNILRAQTADDYAVLNHDDPLVMQYSEGVGAARRWLFGDGAPNGADVMLAAYYEGRPVGVMLNEDVFGKDLMLIPEGEIPLPGYHNRQNIMAAGLMGAAIGIDERTMRRAIGQFRGVAHRMEFVAEVGGVKYINNSMCTNPAAVEASVEAAGKPLVAISGGKHKGGDLSGMARSLAAGAKRVVLIGEATPALADALRAEGFADYEAADSLPDAVARAARAAAPGDTVMLVPGCASFDMFTGFEQRGQVFRDAVRELASRP